jgi:hypothetical protein
MLGLGNGDADTAEATLSRLANNPMTDSLLEGSAGYRDVVALTRTTLLKPLLPDSGSV